jgi:ferritin-like metal-binding protein YciE
MSEDPKQKLVEHLIDAHAMEEQAIQLLDAGASIIGDEEVARIFRAHRLQTEEHERYIADRLEAHGQSPSKVKDVAMQGAAFGLGVAAKAAPDTPAHLAALAFAFENLEIATYGILRRLAQRAGDPETVTVIDRILEEEEAAAELVKGALDRIVDLTLGEPATSPLPGVTPLGKPSTRQPQPYERGGPQDFKDKAADASLGQPAHVSSPTDGAHLDSPEPGYPTDRTDAYGGETPEPENPQPVGDTIPKDRARR